MKKIILSFSLLVILSISVFSIYAVNAQTQSDTNLDFAKLDTLDIKIDEPTSSIISGDNTISSIKDLPVIDEKTAINNAINFAGSWSKEVKNVKTKYCLMTNDSFTAFSDAALNKNPVLKEKNHMDKLPVYIVSFGNLDFNVGNADVTNHVFNVVIDAVSGEPLISFTVN